MKRKKVNRMLILAACEESQAVTIEMRRLGHEAYSGDVQECSGGHPEWHIMGDVLPLLNGRCRFQTMDGEWHEINGRWDMIIAFPPCTHLAVSGAKHFAQKREDGRQREAIEFFMAFWNADCDRIAIENPVNIISGNYIRKHFTDLAEKYGLPLKPSCWTSPNHHGHQARKKTNLWLKNLKSLRPTCIVDPGKIDQYGFSVGASGDCARDENGKIIAWNDPRTAKIRSKTFQGIAKAMAEQWAGPCYPDYVQRSIDRLKAFEPTDGYFVAFSGGKDSQCIYHLCELAGVKFDAHYSVTSVDPPELVRFIKSHYPSVSMEIQRDKDGKPVTMWNLIPKKLMPPTRIARYCCSKMKECAGKGRVTVTGVRWAESSNRKEKQGIVVLPRKSKKLQKRFEDAGAEFRVSRTGGIVMNDDNNEERRMVEQCYRTHKTMVNPIVDWTDAEVWHFLREIAKVESCKLYAEGFDRLGCIGCPMARRNGRIREFERWPKYKQLYLKTFERMLAQRKARGLPTEWHTPEEVFDWWMESGVLPGQMRIDEFLEEESE